MIDVLGICRNIMVDKAIHRGHDGLVVKWLIQTVTMIRL